jgi:hypothetical protein
MFTAFALREQYYGADSENKDSGPEGSHKHPPHRRTSSFYFRRVGCGMYQASGKSAGKENNDHRSVRPERALQL